MLCYQDITNDYTTYVHYSVDMAGINYLKIYSYF